MPSLSPWVRHARDHGGLIALRMSGGIVAIVIATIEGRFAWATRLMFVVLVSWLSEGLCTVGRNAVARATWDVCEGAVKVWRSVLYCNMGRKAVARAISGKCAPTGSELWFFIPWDLCGACFGVRSETREESVRIGVCYIYAELLYRYLL